VVDSNFDRFQVALVLANNAPDQGLDTAARIPPDAASEAFFFKFEEQRKVRIYKEPSARCVAMLKHEWLADNRGELEMVESIVPVPARVPD
jgi:hypothetical protein